MGDEAVYLYGLGSMLLLTRGVGFTFNSATVIQFLVKEANKK